MNLKKVRLFFFDLDGVLSVGKENPRYLGGRGVISKLKSLGKKTFILTNDSTHVREEIYENLRQLGFKFELDEILTSSFLTADYLTQTFGKASFFLVGEDGLRRELEAAGHRETSAIPDVVVAGLDRKVTYEKLNTALGFLRAGAKLVGSYGGSVYMSDRGPALSAGPIVKTLEYGSGRNAIMIGKPSPRMFRFALEREHEKPTSAVMVGDQIETDLLGAYGAGVHTILVLTGVETQETIDRSKIKPDAVIGRVDDLEGML